MRVVATPFHLITSEARRVFRVGSRFGVCWCVEFVWVVWVLFEVLGLACLVSVWSVLGLFFLHSSCDALALLLQSTKCLSAI